MVAVLNSLIEIDENRVAWISGANTKVVEVVLDKMAHNSSPEEMHEQYPHLSLAQIHAALSYYYEHQAEVDADIERRDRFVEHRRHRRFLASGAYDPARQRNPHRRASL